MPTKHVTRQKGTKDPMPPELAKVSGKRQIVRAAKGCDCRVRSAVHFWRSETLSASFNHMIDFSVWMTSYGVSEHKRLAIEFVTAEIRVPAGEMARLRMYTALGSEPTNHDLALMPQGVANSQQVLVATHTVRAYSDHHLSFNVNRDNSVTNGYALICISGYLEGI